MFHGLPFPCCVKIEKVIYLFMFHVCRVIFTQLDYAGKNHNEGVLGINLLQFSGFILLDEHLGMYQLGTVEGIYSYLHRWLIYGGPRSGKCLHTLEKSMKENKVFSWLYYCIQCCETDNNSSGRLTIIHKIWLTRIIKDWWTAFQASELPLLCVGLKCLLLVFLVPT